MPVLASHSSCMLCMFRAAALPLFSTFSRLAAALVALPSANPGDDEEVGHAGGAGESVGRSLLEAVEVGVVGPALGVANKAG